MSIAPYDSGPTSNDLLHSLIGKHFNADLHYQIIAQSAPEAITQLPGTMLDSRSGEVGRIEMSGSKIRDKIQAGLRASVDHR